MNEILYFTLAIIGGALFQASGLALLEHFNDKWNEKRIEQLQRNQHGNTDNHRFV